MLVPKIKKTISIIIAVVFVSACGFTAGNLESDPGYAPLEYPAFWSAESEIILSLGPRAISLIMMASNENIDQELNNILRDIKGIRIRIYEVESNYNKIVESVNASVSNLSKLGWERVVSVNDEDERVVVMAKLQHNKINGVVVLTTNNQQAVFINVIGHVDPNNLHHVLQHVEVDVPSTQLLMTKKS